MIIHFLKKHYVKYKAVPFFFLLQICILMKLYTNRNIINFDKTKYVISRE